LPAPFLTIMLLKSKLNSEFFLHSFTSFMHN
jgi:hypothetical protein